MKITPAALPGLGKKRIEKRLLLLEENAIIFSRQFVGSSNGRTDASGASSSGSNPLPTAKNRPWGRFWFNIGFDLLTD